MENYAENPETASFSLIIFFEKTTSQLQSRKGYRIQNLSMFYLVSSLPVPCIVQNLNASRDCGADSITVTWGLTSGAYFYSSRAVDSNGVSHMCNSADLSCKIGGLKCSTIYTVSAIASNMKCESAQSETVTLETGM